jgi:8-oxo-dGTP pyrophosphatase MutT (NUDIX family)
VVLRGSGDRLEVLLVHRPRYDDWSFPKGKAEPGESDENCAVREVAEETGLRCSLGRELPSTEYIDPKGRPKRVRYWEMEVVGGELAFEHEVDGGRWVSPEAATALLSYPRDVEVLRDATRTSA